MNGTFIFKAHRTCNCLAYVPYHNKDKNNPYYNELNINKIIYKLTTPHISNIICQNNVSNAFVKSALGLDEQELYKTHNEPIQVDDMNKGVDILILWTDVKKNNLITNKNLQSVRGIAGLNLNKDKKGIDYSNISILCNSISSKMKTRQSNEKIRGKDILKLIDKISYENNCKYITLHALDNVITYYHALGYKLVHYPFQKEKTEVSEYITRLNHVNLEIKKIRQDIPSTELNELYKEKKVIMQYLKRFLTGLYDIKCLSNFKLDGMYDLFKETKHGYIEELIENGYKMYKIVHGNVS